ncbi:MAG: tetratricopeptide repeat protein [Acidobacteriota bacterium]|nr:tetratricopeptide repeat protein [Acidobacteriota bacterium]
MALLLIAFGRGAFGQSSSASSFEALLKQGFQLHQQARFVEAISTLERADRLQEGDYFVNLLLGIDMLRTGAVESALPRLKFAARTRPGEAIPEEYLGEAQARLGHFASAAEAFQAAVERSHGSEDALQAWAGFALERVRDIGASLRSYDAGLAVARQIEKAAAMPGTACKGSIPVLERQLDVISISTPTAKASTAGELSICYALEAGKAADMLKADANDQAAVDRLHGDILLRLKSDPAGAQREYQKAIALRPGDPALLERIAAAQLAAGDMNAAKESANASLHLDPHGREALRTLAAIAMAQREYGQAVPLLQNLAQEAPGDPNVQVDLGRALVQTGKAAEALQHLVPALNAGYPDEKGALHAMEARALRQLGRDEEADKASAEARRLSDAFQARTREGGRVKSNDDQ